MLSNQDVVTLREAALGLTPPVLSLYVRGDFDTTSERRTFETRVKNALAANEIPAAMRQQIGERLAGGPRGRTVAMLVGSAPGELIDLRLQQELPVVDDHSGAECHFGEPDLFPLLFAIDQLRYGIVYIDDERWRLFEAFAGEIEERVRGFREDAPGTDDVLQDSKQVHPAYVPSRGGAAKDAAADHRDEWTRRFFQHASRRILDQEQGWDRLILLGTNQDTAHFAEALPGEWRARVAARLPSLSHPEASPAEVLARAHDTFTTERARTWDRLLDDIGERGVWSTRHAVLDALQLGRLEVVAAPWSAGELRISLPHLAHRYGARVAILREPSVRRLHDQFNGLAGLCRW